MCDKTAKKTLSQLGNSNPRPTVYEPVANRNNSACLTSHNFQLWKVSNGPVAERPEKPRAVRQSANTRRIIAAADAGYRVDAVVPQVAEAVGRAIVGGAE